MNTKKYMVALLVVIIGVTIAYASAGEAQPSRSQPVHVYQNPAAARLNENDSDEFGRTIAISDGLMIGGASTAHHMVDRQSVKASRALLFDLIRNELLLTFADPSPQELGKFGSSVALNVEFRFSIAFDNDRVLVGNPASGYPNFNYTLGSGTVYVFDLNTRRTACP